MKRALVAAVLVSTCGSACLPASIEIDVPLVVAHVSPSHGSIDVETDVLPLIGFNRVLTTESVESITLEALGPDGAFAAKAVDHLLDADKLVVVLVPSTSLARETRHRIVVPGTVEAEDGTPLEATLRAEFVTGAE